MRRALSLVVVSCVLAMIAACSSVPELVVIVDAPEALRPSVRRVTIHALGESRRGLQVESTTLVFPVSLTVLPSASGGAVRVEVLAELEREDGSLAVVSRAVQTSLTSSRALRVMLDEGCTTRACRLGATCERATCVPVVVDESSLASFSGSTTSDACDARSETCNTLDDDCDGNIDEDFDLDADDANCGLCGLACACTGGYCEGQAPVQLALGAANTCVRLESGRVACRGSNLERQTAPTPLAIATSWEVSIGPALQVATGAHHTCIRASGDRISCIGDSSDGAIGPLGTVDAALAVPVDLAEAEQLAAGLGVTCAIVRGGALHCWGRNDIGQLGTPPSMPRAMPLPVNLPGPAQALSIGRRHACALLADGRVACWGANDACQCGGAPQATVTPRVVEGVMATAIAAGADFTCAIAASDARVICWGAGAEGQLGQGAMADSPTPVDVLGSTGAISLAASSMGRAACFVAPSGEVRCWGANGTWALGGPSPEGGSATPVVVPLDVGATTVAVGGDLAGGLHACALDARRRVRCWGSNVVGQVANTTALRLEPLEVFGPGHLSE